MELKKLTPEQVKKLREPLPPEAIKAHPTKAYLSTIKAIYVVERLNDVFGIGQWAIRGERVVEAGEKMIVVEARFDAPEYGITLYAFGGNDNPDRGDAYKGAVTDALTKIGSHLEIGMDVFKGLTDRKDGPKSEAKPQPTKQQNEQMNVAMGEIAEAKTKQALMTIYTEWGKTYKAGGLTLEQWERLKENLSHKKNEVERTAA